MTVKDGGVHKRMTGFVLNASTIFLSAFLLFAVQPILGKYLLPWFGGSSSVWAVSLLFFTTMLFVGYLYVYVLTRYVGRLQPFIHLGVVGVVFVATLYSLITLHVLFPSLAWLALSHIDPSTAVLMALFVTIGGPYFLLSTTGPLLQYWQGVSSQREPYALYALSNIASLLALISYPILIEPYLPLHVQQSFWGWLFLIYIIALAVYCIHIISTGVLHKRKVTAEDMDTATVSGISIVGWIALAALPAFLLVSTTTQITHTIAPVPLLWIIPLTLYLVTLILAFAGFGQSKYMALLLLASAYFAYLYTTASQLDILIQFASYLLLLFVCGLTLHAKLYSLRPHVARLPLFYLTIAFGGMIGTLLASIVAPLVFTQLWEFPIGVALAAVCAGFLLPDALFPRLFNADKILLARIVFVFVVTVLLSQILFFDTGVPSITSRNFYGYEAVRFDFANGVVELVNGTTLHGLQFMDKKVALLPSTYYVPTSGVGRAMTYEESLHPVRGLKVGVVGLGTGSMAAYCRTNDTYVFYEIDPRIETIARTYFSYLANCKGSVVREGDARLLLQQEKDDGKTGDYDLLVLDAFSDDTIPVHLLTLQAFELYRSHLHSDSSIIAVHISNRYLNLAPIVIRLAAQTNMSATIVMDTGASSPRGSASEWVLLSPNETTFQSKDFVTKYPIKPEASNDIWTDDYTSLWPVLNFPAPWRN